MADLQSTSPPLTKLLYVTPEMLVANTTLQRILQGLARSTPRRLARIVIDEAHCVSQWGHDFRKDYKELGMLRSLMPQVPIAAFTATATPACRKDVAKLLKLRPGFKEIQTSFNRANLTYVVLKKGTGVPRAKRKQKKKDTKKGKLSTNQSAASSRSGGVTTAQARPPRCRPFVLSLSQALTSLDLVTRDPPCIAPGIGFFPF